MPIPLLFIAAGVGTGLLGIGKGIIAGAEQHEASETNRAATRIAEEAKALIEGSRKNCKDELDSLGNRKVSILNDSIKTFVTEFEKINHIELSESKGLKELQNLVIDKKSFSDLKELQGMASSLVGGVASGAVAGALTAFGAYGAAGVLASASTGTAIASLSGAAATNATLAFFGGGSLAAGGLGMAGGTMVLGGLVAGPALAILGCVVGAKASKNLNQALSNKAEAEEFAEEMRVASDLCIGIRKRAAMFERFLIRLQSVFDPFVYQMSQTIKERGRDYRTYTEEERKCVGSAMALAGAIKAVLDVTILDDEGKLTKESEYVVEETLEKIGNVIE